MLKDLQDLISAGIISPATAEQIKQYYLSKKDNSGNRFNTILGILGALLVGAGIVLVVAHNWDDLGKGLRTFFAFLPMVIGQVLCAYTLWKKNDSIVWRESSSVLLFFGVATAISLVSQIYQVSGSLSGFLLTWLVLTAPLVYIMNSSVTSLIVIAVATWYGSMVGYGYDTNDAIPWYYLLILIFLAPHYYKLGARKHPSIFFHFHNWFLAVSLIINLATLKYGKITVEWSFLMYIALFSVYYLIGNTRYFSKMHILSNPFLITGLLGSLVILFIWSFEFSWTDFNELLWGWKTGTMWYSISTTLLLLAAALSLIIYNGYKKGKFSFDPVSLSAFLFLLCVILQNHILNIILVNCWILVIAIFYIRKGNAQNHFGVLNLGLVIMLILAVTRFFDDQIPFIWRGAIFLAAGVGFFAANYLMLRKRKTVAQNNNA